MRDWEKGLLFVLGAVVIYLFGCSQSRDADILKAVPRINQLSDLEKLLDSQRVPLVVGITGRVRSEAPINCEFGGLRGVVVKQTAVQKFLKRNEKGDWREDSAVMLSTCKEVPWYLDDGTGRVNVVGAQSASGFNFPASNGVFEQSRRCVQCKKKRCPECEIRYDLQGLKLLGVKRTERVLPVGTSLSAVGEAVKDGVSTIRIQKPHKGPFYVSPKSIDELIASHRNWARSLKYTSFGVAIIGFTLIAMELNQYIKDRERRSALQRRADAEAAERFREDNEDSDERAILESDGTSSCVICLVQEYAVVFVPCGHMCCCTTCCTSLRNCPVCRKQIVQMVRTFRP